MLGVQHQRQVENPGLQIGVLAVGTQDAQDVFRRGQLRQGIVDIQAVAVVIMAVGLVAVDRQQGEQRNELQALAQHVLDADVVGVVVVGI